MKARPKISESEWLVMRILWAEGPLTANRIVEKLTATTNWKPTTIRTLVNRLAQKKVLAREKKGREYHYYPVLTELECIRAESHSFLRRVYRGALKPILAAFVENEELSPQDMEELKRILKKKGTKQ